MKKLALITITTLSSVVASHALADGTGVTCKGSKTTETFISSCTEDLAMQAWCVTCSASCKYSGAPSKTCSDGSTARCPSGIDTWSNQRCFNSKSECQKKVREAAGKCPAGTADNSEFTDLPMCQKYIDCPKPTELKQEF